MTIALLTPTYGPDLARFKLLRASLDAVGCTLEHVVVVQTEDLLVFQQAKLGPRVRLVASAEVLPPAVETGRQRVHARPVLLRKLRRSLNKRLGVFADASYDGWHAQQITKLAVAAWPEFDAVITLDSDVVVTGAVSADDFVRDGRIGLTMAKSETPWLPTWTAAAAQLLALPAPTTPVWNYVALPFVFASGITRALHGWLEAHYQQPWWQVLLSQRAAQFSEFSVYGAYAREIAKMDGLFEMPANGRTRWVYSAQDRSRAEAIIAECWDPHTGVDYLVLQASRHHPVEVYETFVREQITKAQRASRW